MRKLKVTFFCLLSMVIILSVSYVALAISSSEVTIASPSSYEYIHGEKIPCHVTVSGAQNNPATINVFYPTTTFNSNPRIHLGQLNRVSTSNVYKKDFYANKNMWVPGYKPGSHSGWRSRKILFSISSPTGTLEKSVYADIPAHTKDYYTRMDSTFFYSSPSSNSFVNVGTPSRLESIFTYNCLAYAVSVNTRWEWPWNRNPTKSELDAYMKKTGSYSNRLGDKLVPTEDLSGCDVIYYSNSNWGSGTDGHFARVVAWNASGTPTIVYSKWGSLEVIKSTKHDPFTGYIYGAPKRYYKYP